MTPIATRKVGSLEYLEQPYTIEDRPLWFHLAGLSETATGYGGKLRSSRCVRTSDGKLRRIYITCYSNIGTAWIVVNGRHVIVSE